jgi:hypothetical protein
VSGKKLSKITQVWSFLFTNGGRGVTSQWNCALFACMLSPSWPREIPKKYMRCLLFMPQRKIAGKFDFSVCHMDGCASCNWRWWRGKVLKLKDKLAQPEFFHSPSNVGFFLVFWHSKFNINFPYQMHPSEDSRLLWLVVVFYYCLKILGELHQRVCLFFGNTEVTGWLVDRNYWWQKKRWPEINRGF